MADTGDVHVPQFETADYQTAEKEHRRFVRGVLFGCGGALIGLALYSLVGIVTGLEIGYIALAVGWLVAKAILKGSAGRGGRRYQIAAVVLTYFAVSMAAVPIAIAQSMRGPKAADPQTVRGDVSTVQPGTTEHEYHVSVAGAIGLLTLIGLASPFLNLTDPLRGVIGLVILGVGLRIAWHMTASRTEIVEGVLAPADDSPTMLNLHR